MGKILEFLGAIPLQIWRFIKEVFEKEETVDDEQPLYLDCNAEYMERLRILEEAWNQNDIDFFLNSINRETYLKKCEEVRCQLRIISKSYKKILHKVQYGLD